MWSNDEVEVLGIPDVVVGGFLRLVTNHRIYPDATPRSVAWQQIDETLNAPATRLLRGTISQWSHFRRLAGQIDARANDI